ncbi:MAG TPA: SBBP repeat-containing protein [Terriglobales bacterium]|nr:SBBP repeat-containing protein [Terriglobales bacterium]
MALLLVAMVIGAGAAFYFAPGTHLAKADRSQPGPQKAVSTVSLPLFFEPNLGQTDPQVKFLARGGGYGLFLTEDEAVLELQPSAISHPPSASAVIRMRLDGANSSPRVSGVSPLPGKSNYFIGNDPSKWRHGIPQFARVEYRAVYPGVDLVYYGDQGQLEFDFRVAPAADPNQIALRFDGTAARIDSGDLILATGQGNVRFHAPRVYQQDGNTKNTITGSFRQIAKNRIGFTIGDYDRGLELVIDPVLSYSTFLGGEGSEFAPQIAIDSAFNAYIAGSTTSSNFPVTNTSAKTGAQNVFIAVLDSRGSNLVYATYLGGTGTDAASGVAVKTDLDGHPGFDVYVAGTTTSGDFPTTSNAFQTVATGSHSFLTKLNPTQDTVLYSTYLAGNQADSVTGLAIDNVGDAFVTGVTTSTNLAGDGFPANPNGFQTAPNGPIQIFATKINTRAATGPLSMLYSTYFGGGNPATGTVVGGGIAVDGSGNMYITGATNFLGLDGPSGEVKFPLFNAQQSCLDEASKTVCTPGFNTSPLDAFVAKLNPNIVSSAPVYSTYLGGSLDDTGLAIAVDSSGAAYVTGSTSSTDWIPPASPTPFQSANGGGQDAFIAKIGPPVTGTTTFPLTYFTYLGGSESDTGQAIAVDATQGAHVAGSTNSPDLQVLNGLPGQGFHGSNSAMVALISTTLSGRPTNNNGDYLTYLGGSVFDQGTGIALDVNNAAYVTGETRSPDFPTVNPFQATLNGAQNAFVSKLGPSSSVVLSVPTDSSGNPTSPSPSPVPAGNNVAFTFDITNTGPDIATTVIFTATVPSSGVASQSAKVTSGSGTCAALSGSTITCTITSLAVNTAGTATGVGVVEVDLTPTIPAVNTQPQPVTVSATVSANGGGVQQTKSQGPVPVTDFKVGATLSPATITAGESTAATVTLSPNPGPYTATISMTDSGLPAATTATFTSSSVSMSGTSQATTTLNIATTARPVTTGSLLRRHLFYASWLPVGGLSLLGLGVGAGYKRRRWLAGALLGLMAGIILLQGACGSTSSAAATGGTPAGNYTITITGASGSVSHNTTVQLIVN